MPIFDKPALNSGLSVRGSSRGLACTSRQNGIAATDSGTMAATVVEAARNGRFARANASPALFPEALPPIIAGFTVTFVSLIGYSAMAGAGGGGGLGDLGIRYGNQRFEPAVMIATVAVRILLVQFVQTLNSKPSADLSPVTSAVRYPAFKARRRGDVVTAAGPSNLAAGGLVRQRKVLFAP